MVLIADSFSFSPNAGEIYEVSTFVAEEDEELDRREVVSEISCCSAASLAAAISTDIAEAWRAAAAVSAVSSVNGAGI